MNCIIVHGCPSREDDNPKTRTYDKHWMPWIKNKLESIGINTLIPLMPEPWVPKYENFKREFEKLDINENTILVGHSCGCAFLVKWLGENKQRIKKLALVAPWKFADDLNEKDFYEYEIDETVKDRVGKIFIFSSDDEEEYGKISAEIFHEAIGGRLIELKGMGHYTQADMGTEKFPELFDVLK